MRLVFSPELRRRAGFGGQKGEEDSPQADEKSSSVVNTSVPGHADKALV